MRSVGGCAEAMNTGTTHDSLKIYERNNGWCCPRHVMLAVPSSKFIPRLQEADMAARRVSSA